MRRRSRKSVRKRSTRSVTVAGYELNPTRKEYYSPKKLKLLAVLL